VPDFRRKDRVFLQQAPEKLLLFHKPVYGRSGSMRGIDHQQSRMFSYCIRLGSSKTRGPWQWVVELTFAWLNQLRRLRVRFEKRADIHEAFLGLAYSLPGWNVLQRQG